ncbi:hypothetical protein RRG08_046442 [Elysia crispata]|uniref:Uncharacterized protein n=1 Tax=Elysia crispata TaxID=231223 RepID=A0AAE0YID2_9GAST|nr:hypothetical protein RRG08_046442 [Elysia crispata]
MNCLPASWAKARQYVPVHLVREVLMWSVDYKNWPVDHNLRSPATPDLHVLASTGISEVRGEQQWALAAG